MKLLCLALLAALSCEAALPPLWQDTAEISAIFKDKNLSEYLPDGEPLIKIEKIEGGWRLESSRHSIEAKVTYLPRSMPGPARFDITFVSPEAGPVPH